MADNKTPTAPLPNPDDNFVTKTYNFTRGEHLRMAMFDYDIQKGQVADAMVQSFINATVLPRLGIKDSKGMQVNYNILDGEFVVSTPKHPVAEEEAGTTN